MAASTTVQRLFIIICFSFYFIELLEAFWMYFYFKLLHFIVLCVYELIYVYILFINV